VIVTLTSTSPLFTVAFSGVFLKEQERTDRMVLMGVFSLFLGIVIILKR
jgi:drug/metabolite transporter (DMT)-like permease